MAVGSSAARVSASDSGATAVHRLGENVFDVIADIGDVATFSGSTLMWIVAPTSRAGRSWFRSFMRLASKVSRWLRSPERSLAWCWRCRPIINSR